MKPVSSMIRLLEELTAARACSPMYRPTIRESTALYSCWNRLLRKMGRAKVSIFRGTLPTVSKFWSFSAMGPPLSSEIRYFIMIPLQRGGRKNKRWA